MLTNIRTVADLDLLEAEILEEEKNLQVLKESLDKAELLTKRMIKTLDSFDERIAELDPIIMPIFRTVQSMSKVQTNVENTLDLLKLIEGYNQMANEEEDILNRGVSLENVGEFLESLNKMTDSLLELQRKKLDFCTCTATRLEKLSRQGLGKLVESFQGWLEEYSLPYDAAANIGDQQIPELAAENLKLISGFALASEDPNVYTSLMEVYIQTRIRAVRRSIAVVIDGLKESVGESFGGSYQKGSHQYIQGLKLLSSIIEAEERFAMQVLPTSEPVNKVIKGVADEWFALTQSMAVVIAKAIEKGAFSDQIFLFDLIGQFSLLMSVSGGAFKALQSSLKVLTDLGSTFLEKLRTDIEAEGRQPSSLPTPINATVFEQTSSLLNCMRRMVEYKTVIECLLRKKTIEGGTLTIPTTELEDLPLMSGYYQGTLRWLEGAIELRAKTYRKSMSGLVFRLNNYRYIQRVLASSYIGDLIPLEAEGHYQEVLQQLRDQYITSWKAITRFLDPNEPLPGVGMATAKDRTKIFINEISDAIKLQSLLAVPDPEFRITLREQVKKTVLEPFEEFYAAYIKYPNFHFLH